MANQRVRAFQSGELERLCKVLADTNNGLTGSELGHTLAQTRINDLDPTNTKWRRLYNALVERQNKDGVGNCVLSFVRHALEPARFLGNTSAFEAFRRDVNGVLSYLGLEYAEDGRFHTVSVARTLSEAEARAGRLRAALSARGAHPDVVAACRKELLADDCFHAVLEASKSVAEKIRIRAGLVSDGALLVTEALSGNSPILRLSELRTDSEWSEQKGFAHLLIGLFGTFRNPTAHTPRTAWKMNEADALDLFTLASYAHRRIDTSTKR
jgi:uncharacterized protein (TIGR02391 family)